MGAVPPARTWATLKQHCSYTWVWVCASPTCAWCCVVTGLFLTLITISSLDPDLGLLLLIVRSLLLPCPPWSHLLFLEAFAAPWKLRSEVDWWENIKFFDQHFKNFAFNLAAKVCGGLQCYWKVLILKLDAQFLADNMAAPNRTPGHIIMI